MKAAALFFFFFPFFHESVSVCCLQWDLLICSCQKDRESKSTRHDHTVCKEIRNYRQQKLQLQNTMTSAVFTWQIILLMLSIQKSLTRASPGSKARQIVWLLCVGFACCVEALKQNQADGICEQEKETEEDEEGLVGWSHNSSCVWCYLCSYSAATYDPSSLSCPNAGGLDPMICTVPSSPNN